MKINALITGATGMVGEGVLLQCLEDPNVENILVLTRKPTGRVHPKLKEIVHQNFFDLTPVADQLAGYNACYFCLGVSSLGMKEEEYTRLTYTLTMHVASILADRNPEMVFCYVSGAGTDSSEKGKLMWARVKGKTENDLMKLPFRKVYAFRPGAMIATPGQKNILTAYKYFSWMFPILKLLFPNSICTLEQVAQAMIAVTVTGYEKQHIEVKDIKCIAENHR